MTKVTEVTPQKHLYFAMNQTDKRHLLAELLNGNVEAVRAYQNQQQVLNSPYRWIIDDRAVGGEIIAVYRDNSKRQIDEQELRELSTTINVWRIEDHSGGINIPDPDEDDRDTLS